MLVDATAIGSWLPSTPAAATSRWRDGRRLAGPTRRGAMTDAGRARCAALPLHPIEVDGTMEGPDIGELRRVAEGLEGELHLLGRGRRSGPPAGPGGARGCRTSTGAIVGRALYEGRFTVAEAQLALEGLSAAYPREPHGCRLRLPVEARIFVHRDACEAPCSQGPASRGVSTRLSGLRLRASRPAPRLTGPGRVRSGARDGGRAPAAGGQPGGPGGRARRDGPARRRQDPCGGLVALPVCGGEPRPPAPRESRRSLLSRLPGAAGRDARLADPRRPGARHRGHPGPRRGLRSRRFGPPPAALGGA